MVDESLSRRGFLKCAAVLAATPALSAVAAATADKARLHIACNQYSWTVFYAREKKDFNASLDEGLAEVVSSGIDGFEPGVGGLAQLDPFAPLLKKHKLEMRSLYVNSTLHEPSQVDASIAEVLAAAAKAKAAGTRIIVTNPSPIRWGGTENKNDQQLRDQAEALNTLGERLRQMGLTLAYHNHDPELRQAAREFHHMMVATDPKNVSLCLDSHWIYRGAGNSQVALFDIVELYGPRITELHLRQSRQGVWSEVFEPGDIDYPRLAQMLQRIGARPLLVIEQAIEEGSPSTLKPVEAFRKSTAYARQVFAAD
jgi:inosose dehydratase